MLAMLRDSVVAVVVERTHPQAIPVAIITMRKSIHGFPLLSYISMGLAETNGTTKRTTYIESNIKQNNPFKKTVLKTHAQPTIPLFALTKG